MKRTIISTGKLLASSLIVAMAFSSTAMAQAKSTSSTPQVDVKNAQPKAISYGSTRSNKQTPTVTASEGETLHEASEPIQLKEGDYPLMAGWFMSKQAQANMNTMSLNELMNSYGIDEGTAIKILNYRRNNLILNKESLRAAGISDSTIESFVDTEKVNGKTTRESLKTFAR